MPHFIDSLGGGGLDSGVGLLGNFDLSEKMMTREQRGVRQIVVSFECKGKISSHSIALQGRSVPPAHLHELQVFLQKFVACLGIRFILLVVLNHHDALLVLSEGRLIGLCTLRAQLCSCFLRYCFGLCRVCHGCGG
jgi:hypothetical protein